MRPITTRLHTPAELRYFVQAADGLLLLGRENRPPRPLRGWDRATRRNLGSSIRPLPPGIHLLACLERQLPHDWQQRYRIRPVLLETFCETPRFAGTCYRAANWIHLGQTQGRGKLDTRHEYAKPVKNIFVKPLCPDWKAILNR